MKTKLHFVFSILLFLALFSVSAQQNYWEKTDGLKLENNTDEETLNEKFYQTYKLNFKALQADLREAPLRSSSPVISTVKISLPNMNGGFEQFSVVETPVLSEELSQIYPSIKTYLGISNEQSGNRARFSVSPQGLQVMVNKNDGKSHFIVPQSKNDNTFYLSYSRDVRNDFIKTFECLTEDEILSDRKKTSDLGKKDANDQVLRNFRIAISTTAEYTNFWDDGDALNGNAQVDALAQVVSTLNRTNEVFEIDMAVNFTLVTGTEIIYTDPATDPYTGAFNSQLQSTLTSEVGESNYDIGHLFHFGNNNGNAGCIGCVCVDGNKGSGFSSHSFLDNDGGPYMSDFFDIDYVPHEIGHQMGANHTWSFSSEGTGVNAEPGSGTTIMGYAGITGSNDVQDHSDPYFHYYSISQILDNLQNRTCWSGSIISNSPPVANAGLDYTIPSGTAFVLQASATDADSGDILFYNWEQIDNGITTSGNFGPDKTNGAVWRSRPPSRSPNRFMPIIQRVISGELTETLPSETFDNSSWETVSNVGRILNFALVVRDRSLAAGVGQTPQSDFDTMTVNVEGSAGPFIITSQSTNETWDVGSNQTVTWDVAGTDSGNVNTPTVNILLSTDGGFTYPFVLASNVPNDGSEAITVPVTGGDTSIARVKVEGNNNIFYAINSSNFTIQESEFVLNVSEISKDVCSPDDVVFNFTYNTYLGFSGTTIFNTTGLPPGVSATFSPSSASVDGTNVTLTISGTSNITSGNYPFTIEGSSGSLNQSVDVEFNLYDTNFSSISILTPTDGAFDVSADNALISWETDSNATFYDVDIATDLSFSNIIESVTTSSNNFEPSGLQTTTEYFVRVRGINDCGNGSFSEVNFTTANIVCNSFVATDVPISILETDNQTDNYTSVVSVSDNLVISDVNVTIDINHEWNNDLDIFLISPQGTSIELSTDNGFDDDNDYINTVFDQEASVAITAGNSPFTGTFIPEGDLSLLNGEMSAGNWTLSVTDDFGFSDGGAITNFTLELCLNEPLSTEEFDNLSTGVRLYPNPNEGEFDIVMTNPLSNDIEVEVFDINGRKIFSKKRNLSSDLRTHVNLVDIQSGIYLVKITSGNSKVIRKIIVN